jgi:hypothetical protein
VASFCPLIQFVQFVLVMSLHLLNLNREKLLK